MIPATIAQTAGENFFAVILSPFLWLAVMGFIGVVGWFIAIGTRKAWVFIRIRYEDDGLIDIENYRKGIIDTLIVVALLLAFIAGIAAIFILFYAVSSNAYNMVLHRWIIVKIAGVFTGLMGLIGALVAYRYVLRSPN